MNRLGPQTLLVLLACAGVAVWGWVEAFRWKRTAEDLRDRQGASQKAGAVAGPTVDPQAGPLAELLPDEEIVVGLDRQIRLLQEENKTLLKRVRALESETGQRPESAAE